MPRGHRKRMPRGLNLDDLLSSWRFVQQPLLTPFTAGSGHALPVAEFTAAHYVQKDISLNEKLWELWPVATLDEHEKALKKSEAKRDKLLPSSALTRSPTAEGSIPDEALRSALPHAERARIANMVRVIQDLHTRLGAAGWLPIDSLADGLSAMDTLHTRQVMRDVPPLAAAVEAAKRLKHQGDVLVAKGIQLLPEDEDMPATPATYAHVGAGVGKYCEALCALWPWTASGLVMSPKVAFGSGIAQIESELWLSIGEACVSLGSHEPCGHRTRNRRPESTDGIHFIILGRLANLIPVHTRYVPYGILHRALLNVAELGFIFNFFHFITGLDSGEASKGAALAKLCAAGASTSPDAWAHALCDTSHRGCVGVGFSEDEKKKAPGKLARARRERDAHMEQLPELSRWELIPDSDSESEEGQEEDNELWSFHQADGKQSGAKLHDHAGGDVWAV